MRGVMTFGAWGATWRPLALVIVLAGLIAGAAGAGRAADMPAERASLKGLGAVRVVVDCGGSSAAPREFQSSVLEADIASRLRVADIGLLGAEERAQGQPTLCLTLLMFVDESGEERMFTLACELSLCQETRLVRQPAARVAAPTWRTPLWVANVPARDLPRLREAIRRDVDRFIAAYRAANAL